MALKVLSTKFIGGVTGGVSAIVGGGFGINAAVNGGGGSGSNVITEVENKGGAGGGTLEADSNLKFESLGQSKDLLEVEDKDEIVVPIKQRRVFLPTSPSEEVKSYLEKTEDFIETNTSTSPFMLVKVIATTSNVDFSGKNLTCEDSNSGEKKLEKQDCKLRLITSNLLDNNISKIPTSLLTEIQDAKTESPEDSYILLELTGTQDKWKAFEKKEIMVKYEGKVIILVNFDQLLYKKTVTINSSQFEALVPLKKRVASFLVEKKDAQKLFQPGVPTNIFKCQLKKTGSTVTTENIDDSCRIIKIDSPNSDDKTLITLDNLKNSSTPLKRADLSNGSDVGWLKLEVDINKFYGTGVDDYVGQDIVVTNHTKSEAPQVIFKPLYSISNNQTSGKVQWLIAKYKGQDAGIKTSLTPSLCNTTGANPTAFNNTPCALHLIEGNQPTTKEEFEKITIDPNAQKAPLQLKENDFYAFQYSTGQNHKTFTVNGNFYLFIRTSGSTTYEKHKFEITALLSNKPTKTKKSLLLSDMGSFAR